MRILGGIKVLGNFSCSILVILLSKCSFMYCSVFSKVVECFFCSFNYICPPSSPTFFQTFSSFRLDIFNETERSYQKTAILLSQSKLCCNNYQQTRQWILLYFDYQYFAYINPPTEEGLSPKRLVYKNNFDTFQSIFASHTTFHQCHASYEFFAHSYLILSLTYRVVVSV